MLMGNCESGKEKRRDKEFLCFVLSEWAPGSPGHHLPLQVTNFNSYYFQLMGILGMFKIEILFLSQ